uniref:hypothetical protein n=1 Tax=Microbacterium sp. TaxID=51671 RepID=UPI0025F0A566
MKFGSKLAAIAVISAGIVLALDANWFAFTALTTAFPVVVGIGVVGIGVVGIGVVGIGVVG